MSQEIMESGDGRQNDTTSEADEDMGLKEIALHTPNAQSSFAQPLASGADDSDSAARLTRFIQNLATEIRGRIRDARRADITASGELIGFVDQLEKQGLQASTQVMQMSRSRLRRVRSIEAVRRLIALQGLLDEAEDTLVSKIEEGFAFAGDEIDGRLDRLYVPALRELKSIETSHTARISGALIISESEERSRVADDLTSFEARFFEQRKSSFSNATGNFDGVVHGVRNLEQRAGFVHQLSAPSDARAIEPSAPESQLRLSEGDVLVDTHEEAIYPQPLWLSEGDVLVDTHEEAIYPQPLWLSEGDVLVDTHEEARYPLSIFQPLTLDGIDLAAENAAEKVYEVRYEDLYRDLRDLENDDVITLKFLPPAKKKLLGAFSNGDSNYFRCEISPTKRTYVLATLFLPPDLSKHLFVKWNSNKTTEYDPAKYELILRDALVVSADFIARLCDEMQDEGTMKPECVRRTQNRPKAILAAYAPTS